MSSLLLFAVPCRLKSYGTGSSPARNAVRTARRASLTSRSSVVLRRICPKLQTVLPSITGDIASVILFMIHVNSQWRQRHRKGGEGRCRRARLARPPPGSVGIRRRAGVILEVVVTKTHDGGSDMIQSRFVQGRQTKSMLEGAKPGAWAPAQDTCRRLGVLRNALPNRTNKPGSKTLFCSISYPSISVAFHTLER